MIATKNCWAFTYRVWTLFRIDFSLRSVVSFFFVWPWQLIQCIHCEGKAKLSCFNETVFDCQRSEALVRRSIFIPIDFRFYCVGRDESDYGFIGAKISFSFGSPRAIKLFIFWTGVGNWLLLILESFAATTTNINNSSNNNNTEDETSEKETAPVVCQVCIDVTLLDKCVFTADTRDDVLFVFLVYLEQ